VAELLVSDAVAALLAPDCVALFAELAVLADEASLDGAVALVDDGSGLGEVLWASATEPSSMAAPAPAIITFLFIVRPPVI
jgi:hypothetical protein